MLRTFISIVLCGMMFLLSACSNLQLLDSTMSDVAIQPPPLPQSGKVASKSNMPEMLAIEEAAKEVNFKLLQLPDRSDIEFEGAWTTPIGILPMPHASSLDGATAFLEYTLAEEKPLQITQAYLMKDGLAIGGEEPYGDFFRAETVDIRGHKGKYNKFDLVGGGASYRIVWMENDVQITLVSDHLPLEELLELAERLE